ncbi:MAG: ClpXP protease specificity-enhancing factor SspB [Mariprofundaceae bacterium]
MESNIANAAKTRKLKKYFERHGRIFIVVDATRDGVVLPDHLREDPALKLILNVRMPQPIYFRDGYLESTFSFSGQSFACHIPLEAIWAAYLSNQEIDNGIMWEEDMPESVREVLNAVRDLQGNDPDRTAVQAKDANVPEAETSKTQKSKKHLRVIK